MTNPFDITRVMQPSTPLIQGFGLPSTLGSLQKLQRAKARARAGTAFPIFGFAGTSILLGAYAGDATANLVRPRGINVKVASLLANAGLVTTSQSFFGNGSSSNAAAFNGFDSRLTLGGTWATTSSISFSAGGFGAKATSAGTMAFSFTGAADTLVIYEGQYGSAGAYSADIDGTTVITASQATNVGTISVSKRTLTFAAVGSGAHTLNLPWVSGAPIIFGAELYLSTAPAIRCLSIAAGGSNSAQWAVTSPSFYGPGFVVPSTIAPDVVIFDPGTVNDWLAGTPISTFSANVTAGITNFQSVSDVLVVTPFPTQASQVSLATQQTYVDALIAACVSLNVPWVDMWRRKVSWEAQNAISLTQDPYHPNAVGVWTEADMIAQALLAA